MESSRTGSASATGSEMRPGTRWKESLKRDGRERIESGKRAAAERIEDIADAIDVATTQLDQSRPNLAGYASRLADNIAGVAKRLRESSIEDLGRDAARLAERNPGLFLLGGAALGIVVARFVKLSVVDASADDFESEFDDESIDDDDVSDAEAESTGSSSGEGAQGFYGEGAARTTTGGVDGDAAAGG